MKRGCASGPERERRLAPVLFTTGAWGTGLVPFATGARGRFRSPSAVAAACAPARRPGRGRLAAPSALPGPAPAPSAAARFPRSRPLPGDRPPFAPAHRALSPTSCRLIPELCPPSADPDGASPGFHFFLFPGFFYGCGFCSQVQTLQPFKNEKMKNLQAGRGRHPQRRAQSDGQGEPAGRRRERGLSRSESARSVKAGRISPGIREDGAGRGLLRGAPTRPLARPHAKMPLKLPEAWRAEPLRCRGLLSAQPRAAAPGPVPFAVSRGSSLCPGAATGQRAPGRALCTPRPCASPARRCAVPSLTPASRGPAAIRSCSPRPFADVLSAHPGIAPSLGGPGWRFPLRLVFFSLCCFFMAGTPAPELHTSPLSRMKK